MTKSVTILTIIVIRLTLIVTGALPGRDVYPFPLRFPSLPITPIFNPRYKKYFLPENENESVPENENESVPENENEVKSVPENENEVKSVGGKRQPLTFLSRKVY